MENESTKALWMWNEAAWNSINFSYFFSAILYSILFSFLHFYNNYNVVHYYSYNKEKMKVVSL